MAALLARDAIVKIDPTMAIRISRMPTATMSSVKVKPLDRLL